MTGFARHGHTRLDGWKSSTYRQQGYTDWLILSLIGVLFLIIFGGGWFAWQSLKESKVEEARLMAQCLADGKKEYECVALLRKSESSTAVIPMPIFIPSGRVSQ